MSDHALETAKCLKCLEAIGDLEQYDLPQLHAVRLLLEMTRVHLEGKGMLESAVYQHTLNVQEDVSESIEKREALAAGVAA